MYIQDTTYIYIYNYRKYDMYLYIYIYIGLLIPKLHVFLNNNCGCPPGHPV